MKLYIGEEYLGEAIAKLSLKTEDYGVVTVRFYGNGYIDESFNGEDFTEPYFSPSFIRTMSFQLKKETLDYIKEEEEECYKNTVWSHDPEDINCPCKDCLKNERYKRKLKEKYGKKIKIKKFKIIK